MFPILKYSFDAAAAVGLGLLVPLIEVLHALFHAEVGHNLEVHGDELLLDGDDREGGVARALRHILATLVREAKVLRLPLLLLQHLLLLQRWRWKQLLLQLQFQR